MLYTIRIAAITFILLALPVQAYEPAIPNVFIYRIYAEPTFATATIKINSVKVSNLSNHDYTQKYFPPGRYIVTVTWPWWSGQQTSETAITVGDDSDYYLKISSPNPKVGHGGKGPVGHEPDEIIGISISEVPTSVGAAELDSLR